jgi:hypothetical protein
MERLVGGNIEVFSPLLKGSEMMSYNYLTIGDEDAELRHKEFNLLASSLWGNTDYMIAGDVLVMPSRYLK